MRLKPLIITAVLSIVLASSSSMASGNSMSAGFNVGLVSPEHLYTTIGAGGLLDWALISAPRARFTFSRPLNSGIRIMTGTIITGITIIGHIPGRYSNCR